MPQVPEDEQRGPGTGEHAGCMSELMRLNTCPNQGY